MTEYLYVIVFAVAFVAVSKAIEYVLDKFQDHFAVKWIKRIGFAFGFACCCIPIGLYMMGMSATPLEIFAAAGLVAGLFYFVSLFSALILDNGHPKQLCIVAKVYWVFMLGGICVVLALATFRAVSGGTFFVSVVVFCMVVILVKCASVPIEEKKQEDSAEKKYEELLHEYQCMEEQYKYMEEQYNDMLDRIVDAQCRAECAEMELATYREIYLENYEALTKKLLESGILDKEESIEE